jgi:hypothetical protein
VRIKRGWTGQSTSAAPRTRFRHHWGEGDEAARSIGQIERLVRADVDAGRIHRLTVGERPVEIDVVIAVGNLANACLPDFTAPSTFFQFAEPGSAACS